MSRELLRQALGALTHIETCIHGHEEIRLGAINVLRAALSAPEAPATAPAQPERKPMMDEEVIYLVRECGLDWHKGFMPLFDNDPTNRFAVLVRAVEAFHGIKP